MQSIVVALALSTAAALQAGRAPRQLRTIVKGRDDAYGASGTSFYTTTEKQDTYDSLDKVLTAKCKDAGVRKVIVEMLDACGEITEALRSALVTVEGSENTFGDAQLSVDVIADDIMWEVARSSEVIGYGASEEEPVVEKCNPTGKYTICWDPLDGSSIVDNNWAVGTIIGVWPSTSGKGDDGLLGATGRDQVTSLVALYGPRTTVAVALDDGVYEFSYGCTPEGCMLSDGSYEAWICSRAKIQIEKDCRIFSPANLRAAKEVAGYKRLVEHYTEDKYTLRYSGGLVPDIYQQFTKNQGVFANPTSDSSPAKLRLAFEAAPFGLLVEKAGGKSPTASRAAPSWTWRSRPWTSARPSASGRPTRSTASTSTSSATTRAARRGASRLGNLLFMMACRDGLCGGRFGRRGRERRSAQWGGPTAAGEVISTADPYGTAQGISNYVSRVLSTTRLISALTQFCTRAVEPHKQSQGRSSQLLSSQLRCSAYS